jgi:hypothetical protein
MSPAGLAQGEAISDFRVGVSVGFGTIIGAYLTAWAAVELDWLPDMSPGVPAVVPASSASPGVPDPEVLKPLARKLLKVLRMVATYEPQAGTQQQTFSSVREKMAASSRSRPSTLQLLYSFSRRAKELLTGGARRPGPHLSSAQIAAPCSVKVPLANRVTFAAII